MVTLIDWLPLPSEATDCNIVGEGEVNEPAEFESCAVKLEVGKFEGAAQMKGMLTPVAPAQNVEPEMLPIVI